MTGFWKKLVEIGKQETVLCVAAVLAVGSMLVILPDLAYVEYIDYKVLAILFSLMVVMEGLRVAGVFDKKSHVILNKADNLRQLSFIMVFLCFFSAMLITNDVALITFVPFTLLMLSMVDDSVENGGEKRDVKGEQAVIIVVLETIAANMGSMLTPVGNPQNLYLYTISGMGIWEFLTVTFPITLLSGVLLFCCCMGIKKQPIRPDGRMMGEIRRSEQTGTTKRLVFYCLLFVISLLSVLRVVPEWIPCLLAIAGTLLLQPKVLLKVDYGLLLTFVCFFIFIGNIGRVDMVRTWLETLLSGRELWVSYLTSQITSNMPAAVLLTDFTVAYKELIRGVNIGGLGTLIASLASVISYKLFVQKLPQKKGRYFAYFTLFNIAFAIILLGFAAIL